MQALTALPANIEAAIDHGNLAGRGDDDHTQYARLGGRSGGQTLQGGTGSGDTLILQSTSHATKGAIQVQSPLAVQRTGIGANVATNRTDGHAASLFSGPSNSRLLFTDDGTLRISAYLNSARDDILAGSLNGANVTDLFEVEPDGQAVFGGSGPAASAALEVRSTSGGLLLPRMTTTQRNAISSPADGLVIYNTSTSKVQARAGGAWVDLH